MRKLLQITVVGVVLILIGISYKVGYMVSEKIHTNPIVIKKIYLPEDISAYKGDDSIVGVMHGATVIIDFYYQSQPFTAK